MLGSTPALFGDPGCHPAVGRFKLDGLVLARYVGNDDWVRRAAAIDPIARPPTNPTRRTMER
jgi:hypothetical protein